QIRAGNDYGVTIVSKNTLQAQRIFGIKTSFWGDSSSPLHDGERGNCLGESGEAFLGGESCPVPPAPPFPPLPPPPPRTPPTLRAARSQHSGATVTVDEPHRSDPNWVTASAESPALQGCDQVPFAPLITAQPTETAPDSPTGINVDLHMPQQGLSEPEAISES